MGVRLWRVGLLFVAALVVMIAFTLREEALEHRALAGENGLAPTPLYALEQTDRVRFEGKLRSENTIHAPGSMRECAAYKTVVTVVQRPIGEGKAPTVREVNRSSKVADGLLVVGADGHLVVPEAAWTTFEADWSHQRQSLPSYVPRNRWDRKPARLLYYEEREQCLRDGDSLWITGTIQRVIRKSTGEARQIGLDDSVAILELSDRYDSQPTVFRGTQSDAVGHLMTSARNKVIGAAGLAALGFVCFGIWCFLERRRRKRMKPS